MSKKVIYSYSTLQFESGDHPRFDINICKIVIRSTQSSKKSDHVLAEYAGSKISPICETNISILESDMFKMLSRDNIYT